MIKDPTTGPRLDFFISHAGHDRAWAEWVTWHLRDAGYSVELDIWDWGAGDNFVTKMRDALERAKRILALFSQAYFEPSRYTTDEWSAALIKDDDGRHRLIPVRVEVCEVPRLLRPLLTPDLFGVNEDEARDRLMKAVRGPAGPGGRPAFPRGEVANLRESIGGAGPRVPGSLPSIWNVQQRNMAFVGRDSTLVDIREQLLAGGTGVARTLRGIGGVGKTQLAIEYAYRFAGSYELVWWIAAERPELIAVQLAALAAEADIAEPAIEVPAAVALLHASLRRRSEWLLIFDNAEDPLELRQWLPGGAGHVLITSRNPNWGEVAGSIDVPVFATEESVTLLRRGVSGISPDDAGRVAAKLGNLPLALAQAAGVLSETGLPASAYLSHLSGHAAETLGEGTPASHRLSLAATVGDAAGRLAAADPAAGVLLRLCASLGPEPIPVSLFTGAAADLPDPLASVARSEVTLHQAAGRISRFGLARLDQDGLQIHRLVQAIIRDRLSRAQRQADGDCIVAMLVASAPADTDNPTSWPRWAKLLPHLLAAGPAETNNPDLRELAAKAMLYLLRRGEAATAAELAEMLHQHWTGQLGPEHVHTLAAARELVHAHNMLGHHSQIRGLIEETVARHRRVLGNDHPDTIRAASHLSVTLHRLGEIDAARELDEDTLARCRRIHGDDHPDTLIAAFNLAIILHGQQLNDSARELAEDTFARCRRVHGDDHPDTLSAATALTSILGTAMQLEPARELAEETLARLRRVHGYDHPDTLWAARILANVLHSMGKFRLARELADDTLARSNRVLGDDHPDTLNIAYTTSVIHFDGGNRFYARKLLKQTLVRCRNTLGDEHPLTLMTKRALHTIVSAMGGHANGRRMTARKKKKRR